MLQYTAVIACLVGVAGTQGSICSLPRGKRFGAWQAQYGRTRDTLAKYTFTVNDKKICSEHGLHHTRYTSYSDGMLARMNDGVIDDNGASNLQGTIVHAKVRSKGITWPVGTLEVDHKGLEVEDQGRCSGCWSKTATTVVEAALLIETGTSIQLSAQHLIDCAVELPGGLKNKGCNGGYPGYTMAWVIQHGLPLKSVKPWVAADQECTEAPVAVTVGGMDVRGTHTNTPLGEQGLLEMVTAGPTEVVVNVAPMGSIMRTAENHKIFTAAECNAYTAITPKASWHTLVVVGYGEEAGVKYWRVLNSWGEHFNQDGYFRIERGTDTCHIESFRATRPFDVTLYNHETAKANNTGNNTDTLGVLNPTPEAVPITIDNDNNVHIYDPHHKHLRHWNESDNNVAAVIIIFVTIAIVMSMFICTVPTYVEPVRHDRRAQTAKQYDPVSQTPPAHPQVAQRTIVGPIHKTHQQGWEADGPPRGPDHPHVPAATAPPPPLDEGASLWAMTQKPAENVLAKFKKYDQGDINNQKQAYERRPGPNDGVPAGIYIPVGGSGGPPVRGEPLKF